MHYFYFKTNFLELLLQIWQFGRIIFTIWQVFCFLMEWDIPESPFIKKPKCHSSISDGSKNRISYISIRLDLPNRPLNLFLVLGPLHWTVVRTQDQLNWPNLVYCPISDLNPTQLVIHIISIWGYNPYRTCTSKRPKNESNFRTNQSIHFLPSLYQRVVVSFINKYLWNQAKPISRSPQ